MQRRIVKTADGSTTIQIVDWDEQYHSMHGAIQEARHVFLKMGIDHCLCTHGTMNALNILEMGFGTGLNCLLTYAHLAKAKINVNYQGVEVYPVTDEEISQLNYISQLGDDGLSSVFKRMHDQNWEEDFDLSPNFTLLKREQTFETMDDVDQHDLLFFDAFGAQVQPELWEEHIFDKMIKSLRSGGVLVTYAAKGSVRRAMQAVGFIVERLPGPPGKREMLRGTKPY